MNSDPLNITEQAYRYLFLVQNRAYWHSCPFSYDPKQDLILTYDFGVFQEIRDRGGNVEFLDHLIDPQTMQKYNYETYDFFAKWHYDEKGDDIFAYRGMKIGNALRIAIWSNIIGYVRILISLMYVKKIKCEKIFAGINESYTRDILKALNINVDNWEPPADLSISEYAFPIHRWVDESIFPSGARQVIKSILTVMLDLILSFWDKLLICREKSINIFIHPYHPTQKIIEKLKNDPNINLIFENYTWTEGFSKERRLPVRCGSLHHKQIAAEMLNKFQMKKSTHWNIDGFPVSDHLYPIIVKRIHEPLVECLKIMDNIIGYFHTKKLNLMVTIANIGFTNCLLLNYCHCHKITTYLIINGLLTRSYLDEAKNATWINSYGESIKDHYFRGISNVVCLGDPRMDDYVNNFKAKIINSIRPTIVIGASGFDVTDLNSYVAVEFDFLYDIMFACEKLKAQGREMDIVLKVRPNGYITQYVAFIDEYFPTMTVQVYDKISIREVLLKADFFISIYSQTLFEASCLGIPVLYYKKDTQFSYPPFDGKSELITAFCPDNLIDKMEMFYQKDSIYEAFQDKKVMEKYVGRLDGCSLDKNIDFIYSFINGAWK